MGQMGISESQFASNDEAWAIYSSTNHKNVERLLAMLGVTLHLENLEPQVASQ